MLRWGVDATVSVQSGDQKGRFVVTVDNGMQIKQLDLSAETLAELCERARSALFQVEGRRMVR